MQLHPEMSRNELLRVIHIEPRNGGAPDRGEANHLIGINIVTEMLDPGISARIEQRDLPTCFRVGCDGRVALMRVARAAGQRKVVCSTLAPARSRENVLNLEGGVEYDLWCAAVFASVSGSPCHVRV
jgi:hypothetical protein